MTLRESRRRSLDAMRSELRSVPVTITTTLVVVGTYVLELALAGATDATAAHRFLSTALAHHGGIVMLFAPVLHSRHSHIEGNLLFFVPFSWLVERRTESTTFLSFVLVAGYGSLFVNVVVTRSIAVGISALGLSLEAREVLSRVHTLWFRPSLSFVKRFKHSAICSIGILLVFLGIAQAMGYVASAAGTALAAHVGGIVLGTLWESVQVDDLIHGGT